jgi:8'-apo-carotenoid 13,14-cleaving dioxygenase
MASEVEVKIRSAVTNVLNASAAMSRQLKNPFRKHLFLTGIHEPMREELTLENLQVTGEIPTALTGKYARIGPNPFKPDPRGHHWFVGDGMVHGIRVAHGKAEWYRNRFIKAHDLEQKGGPVAAGGPRRGKRDTVNTNVLKLAGKTLALVESGPFPFELDENLDTKYSTNFNESLSTAFSAHPHEDPKTGEWHAITYKSEEQNTLWHIVINKDGEVVSERAIAVKDGPSVHECSITEHYVIVFDLPVTISLAALVQGFNFPYRWNQNHQARIGLLPRHGSVDHIIWCEIDPCYVFHAANSFENADGSVTIDCCAYESMFAHGSDGPNGVPCGFERWHVDPVARKVSRTSIDRSPQEFPRIDERCFGQPYRHAWVVSQPGETVSNFVADNALYHHDLKTGEKRSYRFGDGLVGGEFVFVPRSDQVSEAEGWLMGLVIDASNQATQLQFFDALNIEQGPVGAVHIPHRIPPGFHGNWISD